MRGHQPPPDGARQKVRKTLQRHRIASLTSGSFLEQLPRLQTTAPPEHRCYRPAANLRTARIAPPEAAKCRLALVVGTHGTDYIVQKCTASLATVLL